MLRKQKNAKLTALTKSFKGKIILITGANGAFGFRAAKKIADFSIERFILINVRDYIKIKWFIKTETIIINKSNT
jgi:FlaA1/EpsC-like NDP-sugar epimerase